MPEITANVVVSNPRPVFTDSRTFRAVANGRVYIGAIDTDPTIPSNQIPVYIQNESGSSVQIGQPLIVNAAGKIVYGGQIVKVVTQKGHSMAVYDAYNALVDYIPNVLGYEPDQLRGELITEGSEKLVDDSRIAVQQKIKDATVRSQHDKNADTVNVKDFGAKGDGVTDDSAAIQAAANTGAIYFPPGNYIVSQDITINAATDCVVKGSSRADTSITYTGTGTLFSAKFTNSIRFHQCSDIEILVPTLNQAQAFYVEYPEDFEHGLVQRGSFFNVSFRGVDEYEQGFNTAVHQHQGDNINFINCAFKGAGGSLTDTQAYNTRCAISVRITGRFSPVEYRFTDCYFGSVDACVKVEDTAEGIYFNNCIFICCNYGIYWTTGQFSPNWPGGAADASGRPLLSAKNNHFNFYKSAVYTSGVVSIHESGNLCYHNEHAAQSGIAFAHGNGTDIFCHDNEVWCFHKSFYCDMIDLYENVTYSRFYGNRLVSAAPAAARYAVQSRGNSKNNDFFQNSRRATGSGTFVDSKLINDLSGGLNNIGIKGGLFYSTGNQPVASGTVAVVEYGARDYDPDGLWKGSGGDIVIPAGVSRVRVSGGILMDAATSGGTARELYFTINGQSSRGMGQMSTAAVSSKGTYMNIMSAVVLVSTGDIIRMNVRHDDGASRTLIGNQSWMQVEIIA